ncbi:hypothetical protein EDC22_11659 [Tepidamorphus gemmatus]|jgi:hypothetical protein|uniref:Uncharacterized protein n=1 Tax=Tepidamorphus gemmatus TaxID=747076 RepID=A0A4R3LUG7_9HYPH|nr:hypothetical protein [Tepidamorphus gemmatus]TCT04183.1 hypothetical protein EDC22_11659 [Tepidamorphus gemmatus]
MSDTFATVVDSVIARGDLAHLALFLWAGAATGLAWLTLRELARSNRRFEEFVATIARIDRILRGK